jgi:hypothetical protein
MIYRVTPRGSTRRSIRLEKATELQTSADLHAESDKPAHEKKTSWLRDHWSQVLVLCVSLLTAACYLVGRAKLLGWYDAAGIPHLMFAWSAQDLVIRGLVESETWLLLLAGVAGFACLSAVMDITTAAMRRHFLERSRLRIRGESCDQLGLRKRLALEARRLRKEKDARAQQATRHWHILEKRGMFRRAPKKSLQKASHWVSSDVYKSLLLLPILYLLMMAYLLVNAFYAWSHRNGAKNYWMEHIAATSNWPPSRGAGGWIPKDSDRPLLEELSNEGKMRLREYSYVQVKDLEDQQKNVESPMCGWMIQATGNVLVLLNSSGLLILNFADSPFRWTTVSPDACGVESSAREESFRG